jgi:hypothetical protein
MSSTLLIMLGIAALAIIVIGASMRNGPRITQITRTVKKDEKDEKGGDDA